MKSYPRHSTTGFFLLALGLLMALVYYLQFRDLFEALYAWSIVSIVFFAGVWFVGMPYLMFAERQIRINNNMLHVIFIAPASIQKIQYDAEKRRISIHAEEQRSFIYLDKVRPAQREELLEYMQKEYQEFFVA